MSLFVVFSLGTAKRPGPKTSRGGATLWAPPLWCIARQGLAGLVSGEKFRLILKIQHFLRAVLLVLEPECEF